MMDKVKLDAEEQALLDSLEAGEWQPVPDLENEIAKHVQYAKNTMKKDKRVNIRISSRDLEGIQTLALEDGIPYQTLMSSILHKFVTGKLVERQRT